MNIEFSRIYHAYSKRALFRPPKSPVDWETVRFKQYPRLPLIKLDDAVIPHEANLFEILRRRRSLRDMAPGPISFQDISTLLSYACGLNPEYTWHRTYPSGGARYSIEVYPLVIHAPPEISAGLYHFDVAENSLRLLDASASVPSDVNEWWADAPLLLFFTTVFRRTNSKYHERGYRLLTTEAGHIAQNLQLVGTALNLKTCQIGGHYVLTDERIEKMLDVDGVNESVIGRMALGT